MSQSTDLQWRFLDNPEDLPPHPTALTELATSVILIGAGQGSTFGKGEDGRLVFANVVALLENTAVGVQIIVNEDGDAESWVVEMEPIVDGQVALIDEDGEDSDVEDR